MVVIYVEEAALIREQLVGYLDNGYNYLVQSKSMI
jgi:hypothetical protein